MIKTKTVFILGAGASCPYGFPLGTELRQEICQYYSADISNYLNGLEQTRPGVIITQEVHRAKVFAETFRKLSSQMRQFLFLF